MKFAAIAFIIGLCVVAVTVSFLFAKTAEEYPFYTKISIFFIP